MICKYWRKKKMTKGVRVPVTILSWVYVLPSIPRVDKEYIINPSLSAI